MPIAPRQGRKGGKISSSPAIAATADQSPSTVSPGTLPPGGMSSLLPSDPHNVLDFDLDALVGHKKALTKNTTPATAAAAAAAAPAGADNVLKFDIDAIQQIGQGVVIGGNKQLRIGTSKPLASIADVKEKLNKILTADDSLSKPSAEGRAAPCGLVEANEHDVVIVKQSLAALSLAVALSTSTGAAFKVLVVVPRFFEVASVAEDLRKLKNMDDVSPASVGEFRGQSCLGTEATRLWVTCADTALVYLHAQKSLAPFTHVVVPNLSRMTPLTAYFLWGLRERVFRHSANLDKSAPPLRLLISASEGNLGRVEKFFSEQNTTVVSPKTAPVVDFSYDEVTCLAGMDVLDFDVDTTGKFAGPHWKLVEHCVKLATAAVTAIIADAKNPMCIYVLTADTRETVEAIQASKNANCVVFSGRVAARDMDPNEETLSNKHRVFVMSTILHFADVESDAVHFVLDMGTTRRIAQPSKSESFMTGSSTEWASAPEIAERRGVLGCHFTGGYVALYPPVLERVFPKEDNIQPVICDVEDAMLQCSRAEIPMMLANDVLVPCDHSTIDQVLYHLSEKCLIANPKNPSITFLGEVMTRLPLELDLAHFVINGCSLGLGEAAIVAGAVAALSFRTPLGSTHDETNEWKNAVLESRNKYALDIATQSDLLADTLVYLEWLKLKVSGASTAALIKELQVRESRMEQIQMLTEYLRVQLSDYAFIDHMGDADAVALVVRSIRDNAAILTFVESVALARRVSFVRDAGTLKIKDRAAALAFVRSSKKVTPNVLLPSAVPWNIGAAVVPIDLRNFSNYIACSRVSIISTSYLFASLLLMYPQVEYSSPVDISGKGRVVYFGLMCNGQMRRFRTSIEEAAEILDFRERWNKSLGYLQALRTLRRPISRHRFEVELKSTDRNFDLTHFHHQMQRSLMDLVTELEVAEHQGSFDTLAVHCLAPKEVLPPVEGAEASDIVATQSFQDNSIWRAASPRTDTPATAVQSPASLTFPTNNLSIYDDDEDEIEFIAESYFMTCGPIIDDDDDE